MRILILGGTTEAASLVRHLAGRPGLAVTLSLAGRTAAPARLPVETRIGGFGGAEGLAAYPLRAAGMVGRRARIGTPDAIPPSLLGLFRQEIALDHRRADAALGFARTAPAAALAEAAGWFLRAG